MSDEVMVFSIGEMIRTGNKAKYLSQDQTLHHKSHMDWPGIYDKYVQKFGQKHLWRLDLRGRIILKLIL
jgi:hypothetical protein